MDKLAPETGRLRCFVLCNGERALEKGEGPQRYFGGQVRTGMVRVGRGNL